MAIARSISTKRARIEELKGLISKSRPEARFKVTPSPDARDVTAIWAYSNADFEELSRLVEDAELRIMDEDRIHIVVIPMPLEAWEG
jgi:hypothetical protein